MDQAAACHLKITMQMVSEELTNHHIPFQMDGNPSNSFHSMQPFMGQKPQKDVLYFLTAEYAPHFPVDSHSYICTSPIPGNCGHIFSTYPQEKILHVLFEMFARYRDYEMRLNQLLFRESTLDELCQLASELLGNPIYIHDDWFLIIASSDNLPNDMPIEFSALSSKGALPRQMIDNFRQDSEYLKTYTSRNASLWIDAENPDSPRCIYCNLVDETRYRGRMLCIDTLSPFQSSHYMLLEYVAQLALLLLHRRQRAAADQGNPDRVMQDLLSGGRTESPEAQALIDMLHWQRDDAFLCIRLHDQAASPEEITEHALHAELFRVFPKGYIMFWDKEQCIILNLSHPELDYSMIRQQISFICRDYCLYGGISSPVYGLNALPYAFMQAGIGLDHAFSLRSEKWVVPFADAALEFILQNIQKQIPGKHLASPELYGLLSHDQKKGTAYYETLRAFLLNERDIPKTSKELNLHRTTLIYRINRIQEMTNLNLDKESVRLYLLLSFRLLDETI